MNPDLYRRRLELLRMVYMGEDPHRVIESMSTEGSDEERILNPKLYNAMKVDWGRRAHWIPELVRASSRDLATFQSELLGVAREVRKRAFDIILDKETKPMIKVMALNTIMSSVSKEMDIIRFVRPTTEVAVTTTEGKREALRLILSGLEESDPDLAFMVSKVLSGSDLASLPKLQEMK